jgi:hypothetical protein
VPTTCETLTFKHFQSSFLEIELQKHEQKFTNGVMDFSQVRVKRIPGTKTQALYGPMIIRGPIYDTYKVKMTIYKKQGGQYRLMPLTYPLGDACSLVSNDPHFVPDLTKHSNMTLPLPCPVTNVSEFNYQTRHLIESHFLR